MEPIYLSEKEIEKLQRKKIGSGSEAHVYKASNEILYKIYHNDLSRKITSGHFDESLIKKYPSDDSDVKVVGNLKDVRAGKHIDRFASYYDEEGVKLYDKNAIIKAIQRQPNIEYTSLPKTPIYRLEDYKLLGCALKYHKNHTDLHNLSFLPRSTKIKIMKKILRNLQELLKENIYHIDLANKKVSSDSHSNILVSFNLEPQIIDVDGRSAIYTENPSNELTEEAKKQLETRNQNLLATTYASLSALILDFLYDEDIVNESLETDLDILILQKRLLEKGLPETLSEYLINGEATLDIVNEVLNLKQKR